MTTGVVKNLTLKRIIYSFLIAMIPLTIVSLSFLQIYQVDLKGSFIAIEGIILIVTILLSLSFMRRLTSPIKQLSKEIEEIAKGNWDAQIQPTAENEVGALTESSNHIVQALRESTKALREAEEKYQRIFENLKDMIYITSVDGKLLDVNRAGVDLFGYESKKEMMKVDVRKTFLNPEDRKRFRNEIRKEGFVKDFEVKLKRIDGTPIDVLITANARKDDSGNISYLGIIKDISDRKRMEEGLINNRMYLLETMDMARIAYWEFDYITEQFFFNDAFYALYGTTAEAEGGYQMALKDYAQRFIYPDDIPVYEQVGEEIRGNTDQEQIVYIEHRVIRRDGEIRHIAVRIRIFRDASGNIIKTSGSNQDITDRKRMEEELVQRTRELETLYDLSVLINQSLDLDTVFHTALEKALSLTGFEMGAIFLLNEKGDALERKSQIGIPPTIFEDGKILKYGEGVSGKALVSKQPVVASINEYSSYRKAPAMIEEGIQTLVGFPLISKGKAIGTISLMSHFPLELSQRETNLLESIGNQIGIALENAKLFSNVARAKSEWETTFDAVAEGIIIIDKNYRIIHANKDAHERIGFEPKDLIGKKCFEALEHSNQPCEGCCVSETFITKKSAFLERENKYTKRLIRLRAFPIFDESGESEGAVELISDITEEKRREMEKEIVSNVNKILASSLDVKEVIRAARAELNRVLDSERMSIALFDEEGEGFQIFALEKDYDGKELVEGIGYPLKGTPFEKVAERGLPLITMDTTESDSWTSKKLLKEGICSSLVFPLEYKGKVIGTMNFGSKEANHFSEKHIDFLRSIAPGMAISIKNALLFEETIKRLDELTILYEIMKISASSLNLDKMLREIINSLNNFFKFDALGILLINENTKRLLPHPASYKELSMMNIGKLELCVGKGITGWVAEKGEPLLVNDISQDSRYICGDESICSEMCIPLKVGQKVIGVIDVQSRALNAFFENDLRLLSIIGGQLATLIENLRLYEEIKQSEEKYRTVIEGAHDGICVIGEDNRFKYVNKRMVEIQGYAQEELIGKDFLNFLDEGSKQLMAGRFTQWERGKKLSPRIELSVFQKNGEMRNIEINARVMKDSKGDVNYIVFVKDITEQKKMEEQLLQAEKLRSLAEMASGVAHDFNNALAVVLGNTQLLLYTVQDEEIKKSLKTIEKVAKDSAQTVRRLQDFTRKGVNQELFKVDLNTIIKDSIGITKPKWKDEIQSRGLRIEIVTNLEEIPLVLGNPSELREVITNMIFNAIEALPGGGKIEIRTFQKSERVFIQISDTGIGIAEEIRKKIFEPFFTTKPFTNTGLGLSMAYGIIKRFEGEIEVESKVGEGTLFTIILPVEGKKREEGVSSTIIKGRKAHILVIDDEEFVRSVLSRTLAQVDHQVTLAENGEKGIELFKERKFDMVLTDLGMPGMSGWEVCRMIKEISPDTPVGMITGWGMEMSSSKIEEYGLNFIISKPFDLDQILNVVAKNIRPSEERLLS